MGLKCLLKRANWRDFQPVNPTTEAELIAAMVRTPDEDGPRLVYADALTAEGDPRGDFISLQCRRAAQPDDEARKKLKLLENKLLATHRTAWLAPLAQALVHRNRRNEPVTFEVDCEFERGFANSLVVPAAALSNVRELFLAAPLLRQLQVVMNRFNLNDPDQFEWPVRLKGCFDAPEFLRLSSLSLRIEGLGNDAADAIATATSLRELTHLHLGVSRWDGAVTTSALTDRGVAALTASEGLPRLERLDLSNNRIGLEGVERLVQRNWPLKELSLANNLIGSRRASEVLTQFKHLRALDLGRCELSPADARTLASSTNLSSLEHLGLEHCQLGADGAEAFIEALTWPNLTSLDLSYNLLGDAGALAVAESPKLASLRSLQLGHNRIGKKGAKALASSPHLSSLTRLLFAETWKPEVVAYFTSSPTLANCKVYLQGRLLANEHRSTSKKSKPS